MRLGKISNETDRIFKSLSRALSLEDGLAATELYSSPFFILGNMPANISQVPDSPRS